MSRDLMLDMHAHLLCLSEEYRGRLTRQEALALGARELGLRAEHNIYSVFSCGTPQEWEFMRESLMDGPVGPEDPAGASEDTECGERAGQPFSGHSLLSFGIHPWRSASCSPQDCREYFRECRLVGEIGMDSVWCDVPLKTQRRVFARQLEFAAELGKPVILHTKGQEAQIADMLRDFPGRVCVHWYSGDFKCLERYMEADCYFTLGPDLAECMETFRKDTAECPGRSNLPGDLCGSASALYERMLREIPAERLFLETDGLSSIAWMRGTEAETAAFEEIPEILDRNLRFAAQKKQMRAEKLRRLMWRNFREFIG